MKMAPSARSNSIRIREITDPRDAALAKAYRLLSKTFPPGERVDKREWTGSLRESAAQVLSDIAWHLIIAEDADGTVLGLVSGTYLGNVNVGVIGYLAIDSEKRAAGLGSRLRAHLRRACARDALRIRGTPLDAIIGEVSPSNPWLRKLRTREGVLVLDLPYFQPRLRESDLPSPFALYYESIGRQRKRLPVPELRRILYAIWRRIYRIPRPLERPAFRAMMRALEGRRTIGASKHRTATRTEKA
jgi:GNAT superfamily N-acetyltransferase